MDTFRIIMYIIITIVIVLLVYTKMHNDIKTQIIKINSAESKIDESLRQKYDLLVKAIAEILQTDKDNKDFKNIDTIKNEELSSFEFERKLADIESKIYTFKSENTKINKNISFKSKSLNDTSELLTSLEEKSIDAIILEDAQLEILKEANDDLYNSIRKLDAIKVEIKNEDIGKSVDVTNKPFNVYISGIDTYGSINKVSRSDVNILMSVNPIKKEILLTNIPRDYYVKLHTFKEYDKLTHAGIYGVNESIKTIEDLLDTKINYYIKVNFTSLVDIVDALDGITVNSNYNFVSNDGYYYVKGANVLDGKKALSFARERKSFKEGDRVRGENQQLVLTSLINKAMSPKIITNYVDILKALKGKFITNISDDEITKLIKMQLNDGSSWNIKSISVNGSDAMDYVYSYKKTKLYVMKPDEKTVLNAKNNIKRILDEN